METPVSITPKFNPGQFVRHITDDASKGVITAFMVRGHNHSYEVQWNIERSGWHLDYELSPHEEPTRQIGFWSETGK